MSLRELSKAIDRLYMRIMMAVCRGKVTFVNDAAGIQIVQVKFGSGEVIDGMSRVQEYGFTSVPQPGAHAIAIFIGGERNNGAVIATNDLRSRLKGLQPGEVAIYDDLGQKVHLTRTGIVIQTPLTLRLQGKDIQLHATNSIRWDANGHGQHWFPTYIDTYQIGEVSGTAHPISPPEIT